MREEIDLFIPTYNSEAHLQACLDSVKKTFPIRRIVLIDRHSTDSTHAIAKRNDCEIILEDGGLAYARELSIKLAETEIFAMVESDLVYEEFSWYQTARGLLQDKVAAVVAYVPRESEGARGRFNQFWSRFTPLRARKHGFSAGSTILTKAAVSGIAFPRRLQAYEDIYLMRNLQKRGWTYKWIEVKGIHHSDLATNQKAAWYGANARILYALDPSNLTLFRRHLLLPIRGAIASIVTLDPGILTWSVAFSLSFFRGWANPERFRTLKR